jgi:hypothetical protein
VLHLHVAVFVARDELDDAVGILLAAAFGAEDADAFPLGLFRPVFDFLAVAGGALFGVGGVEDEIDVAGGVGGVARTHEFFGCFRLAGAEDDGFAAVGEVFAGTAGAEIGVDVVAHLK